jgi:DNA-binding response OmpR family regulator
MVVEDEEAIADLLRLYLTREGFGVHVESDGLSALEAIERIRPVLVLLDVGLPSMDGREICRRMRDAGDWTPVIFVTAQDDEIERIDGLQVGADDYVTKPFSPREVVLRVQSLLRRSEPAAPDQTLSVGRVVIDPARRTVLLDEEPVDFTAKEFDLLEHLVRHAGQVVSREALLSAVWGYEAAGGTRTVDVHVAQVRRKLGGLEDLRTVRGIGYIFDPPVFASTGPSPA